MGDDEMVRVMMVEEKFAGIMTLDSRDALAAKLFGEKMGGWVYATIGKVKVPCAIMWFASAVVGILSLFGVLSKSVCLLSFTMGIWLLVTFWLKANPHLILRLFTNFDVWYVAANSALSLVGLVDVFRGDVRIAFIAVWWLSTMTVIWFDAGHVTAKRGCALGNIVGIIVIITFIAGLQFASFPT